MTTRLLLGIMVTTMFLSMWISNTSTTVLMVPIVEALIKELDKVSSDNHQLYDIRYIWQICKNYVNIRFDLAGQRRRRRR